MGETNLSNSRIESVAIDVFLTTKVKGALGALTEAGLASLHLYHTIYFTDSHLTEYLLAWSVLNQNTNKLQTETLKSLYHTQPWGNEAVQICVMVSAILFLSFSSNFS